MSTGKKSLYRAFNCIFGKVGRVACDNVVHTTLFTNEWQIQNIDVNVR